MSRRANALIQAAFSYAQMTLSILTGFLVTRFVVRNLGVDLYGLWLATGAVISYSGLVDLGIFAVMPLLIAEADARKDVAGQRSLLVHGLLAGLVSGALYVGLALLLWLFFPDLMHLNAGDRAVLAKPLLVSVLSIGLCYPLRMFVALRNGFQDYKYMGPFQLLYTLSNAIITVVGVRLGFGLYALSIAMGLPPFFTAFGALFRTRAKNPELLRDWPRPSWAQVRPILTSGTGIWLGMLGWQFAFASDSVILATLGLRGDISRFVITSRLCIVLMQSCWVLPDSAGVGLAHLYAEGDHSRTADIVRTVIRLTLFLIGGVVCVTLAINAGFVGLWVGPEVFAGSPLNAIFALDVVALSITHALVSQASVLGYRIRVGLVTVANGVLHLALALLLGHFWGLCGVGVATALSAFMTSIPVGIYLLRNVAAIKLTGIVREIVLPWTIRLVPCALAAAILGWNGTQPRLQVFGRFGPFIAGGLGAAVTGLVYLLCMRTFIRDLPFGPRVRRILVAMRLA